MNPFTLIPHITTQGFSALIPSLDSVIKIADPRYIPQASWLRSLFDQAIMPAAMAILLFAFCAALIQEQRRAASGTSDFTRIFYSLLFHFAILAAYPFLFVWIVDATQALGDLFLDDSQISNFIQSMHQQFIHWDFGVWVAGIVAYLTYLAAFVLFFLFFLARYMLLSLIFMIGPIVIGFSVWDQTSRFRAWLVGFIQVASWVVIFKFIIAVSLSFSLDRIYNVNQTNLIFVIAANVLYVVMLWHTPAIAATIIGGASLGFLGTQVLGVTTEKTVEGFRAMNEFNQTHWARLTQPRNAASAGPASAFNPLTLSYDQTPDPYGADFHGKKPRPFHFNKTGKTYSDPYGSGEAVTPDLGPGIYADPYGSGKTERIEKKGEK